jgi:hypothetical protein
MRWRNADAVAHNIVSDTACLPEFTTTGTLTPGAETSFVMNTVGMTRSIAPFTRSGSTRSSFRNAEKGAINPASVPARCR